MKKLSSYFIGLLLGLCIIICGCYTIVEVNVINHTGERIIVFSSYSKKLISIDNDESEGIVHFHGSILVTIDSGKTWHYPKLSLYDLPPSRYFVKKNRLLGNIHIYNFLIDKDGKIYVIPPGEKHIDTHKLKQPVGFPLIPK